MTKLSITVHENDEITLKDERGLPVVCKDCRFAGWLTEWEFNEDEVPWTCLYFSGGADPRDGDRVLVDTAAQWSDHYRSEGRLRKRYPLCSTKNANGDCTDFVRARPLLLRWWEVLGSLSSSFRKTLRRRMRT
jgi:hypothetical protein